MSVTNRRLIPPTAALVVFLAALSPLWSDWVGESVAIRWTLLLVATVFAVKAALFWWMRQRMVR